MKGKTFLVIAHRFSTIKDSDIIFVFKKGKLVEKGKYQELMNKKEEFFRISRGL